MQFGGGDTASLKGDTDGTLSLALGEQVRQETLARGGLDTIVSALCHFNILR